MPRRRQEFDDFIVRDDDGMEVDEPGPSKKRRDKPSRRRNEVIDVDEDVEGGDKDEFFEKYKQIEFVNKATLVSMNHKGFIKETDLKPFLTKNRNDWQDGLKIVQNNLEEIFGFSLVHCGAEHIFTLRNNLLNQTAAVSDLFDGKLNHERIDDGGYQLRNMIEEENKEDEALLFPVLTLIMMSGGDKSNKWTTTGDVLKHFVTEKLEVPTETYNRLLGGKTPLYVKQHWIRRTVYESDGTEPIYHFYWGERAQETISGSKLLEKYCLATGIQKACFGSFYKQLQEEDYKKGLIIKEREDY